MTTVSLSALSAAATLRRFADAMPQALGHDAAAIRRPFDDHDSASQFFRPDSFETGSSMAGGGKMRDAA
jgi:hypothetical protein